MNPTCSLRRVRARGADLILAGALLLWVAVAPALAADNPMPRPPELEHDVQFWVRVYSEIDTNSGFIHDDQNLAVVYETLHFAPNSLPHERQKTVEAARDHYAEILRRIAGVNGPLSAEDQHIRDMWGPEATPSRLVEATDHIRFHLGQSDRFREGLRRSGAWETHIAETLANMGLPAELAVLPHVESSFNPAAYSKVGAAGLWQFMRSTGRRHLHIDNIVDQRLDPYSATEAAANLMLYNYRLLGSWPLAVTAYNHGPGGLRRAQEELGTSNIEVIVKRYQGATFGFASRNFYVAFLAALEVDRHAEKYFGPLMHLPDAPSSVVVLPDYIPVDALAKAFKADLGALKVLNPALRPPIWNKARFVPRGYALRVPGTPQASDIAAAWARLPPSMRYVVQRNDGPHRG